MPPSLGMNEEEEEDDGLLGCIQKECIISASQELYLQNCPFAGESDLVLEDSDDDFTTWTNNHTQLGRIVMVSPPESPKDHEVFQTPPEGSIVDSSQDKEAAAAAAAAPAPVESIAVRDDCVDSLVEEDDEYAEAVNLSRESDNLGFSSEKLNQVSNHVSIDPGSKPLEIETSSIINEEEKEALRKRSGSRLLCEDRRLKRNGGEGTSSSKIATDDIERFKYVSSSVVPQKRMQGSPVATSIGRKANGENVRQEDNDTPPVIRNEIYNALLDSLQLITGKKNECAPSSASASEEVDLLETAQRRGIVFPRPRWWRRPPEEFDD